MIGASKILTVSYGTFSCTLEGFDDPFNTMKAIAEYFRDLAADDRYFGAEPPTPDAAMLHRIAEREMQRRVEAKIENNSVILRAADAAPQPAPRPAPAPAPVLQSDADSLLTEESVAAKLQRIRAAVARAAVPMAPVVEDAVYVEDEVPEVPAPVAASNVTAFTPRPVESAPQPVAEPLVVEAAEDPAADEAIVDDLRDEWEAIEAAEEAAEDAELAIAEEDLRAVFEEPDLPEEIEAAEVFEAEAALNAEAEAAEDADLIAVLADETPAALPEQDEAEPDEAEFADAADDAALIAALSEDEGLPTGSDSEVAEIAAPENLFDEDSIAAFDEPEPRTADAAPEADQDLGNLLAALAADDTPAETAEAPQAAGEIEPVATYDEDYEDYEDEKPLLLVGAETAASDEVFPDDLDEELIAATGPNLPEWDDDAEEFKEELAFEAPATPAAEFDEEIDTDEAFDNQPVISEPPHPPQIADGETAPANEKLRRARARVIKVRRVDAPAAEEAQALSPEAEADLQRELSEANEPEAAKSEREGLSILASSKGDEDVSRLLRQANTEMDVPENKRRLSTLAHLKAAVAATVADLRAPNPATGTGEPSRLDRYRADLARVMRPRRTEDMPVTERPAPLVLVSEQRIDRPSERPAEVAPTRILPRRISAGNLALEDDDSDEPEPVADTESLLVSSKSFVEFAERLGASDMSDLLEAAAAYTACVEGRPNFSRPHLMRHVTAVAADTDATREDSMRSFGQLLRQGKIEKVKRGQFAITDSSYFLAEARRMTS